ncbi:MAG TPA: pyridoxal-phosphate dependent enzyme [Steroidobacter sp.]
MSTVAAPSKQAIETARANISGFAVRTPLLELDHDGPAQIYLKLEQLQPIGSFKIRGAVNALMSMSEESRRRGVITASAGNFAQGLGYAARKLGVTTTALVPDTAAQSKLLALERLGVQVERRPYAEWWSILEDPGAHGFDERFVHPCADPRVMAGNATIALEILEELQPASVLIPYGGGGLTIGIAVAMKARHPGTHIVVTESEAGTPVSAALSAKAPVRVNFNSNTFITGMGSPQVLPSMWPLVREYVDEAVSVSLGAVADAIRLLLERHHIVAEGAGAVPVAAALARRIEGPVVCIVSGGHLDTRHLIAILQGETP